MKITKHKVYRVTISIAPDLRRIAFERSFLGLPTATQVAAYIQHLIDGDTRNLSLPNAIRQQHETCLKMLAAYGLPSVEGYPGAPSPLLRGTITAPQGHIELSLDPEKVMQVTGAIDA